MNTVEVVRTDDAEAEERAQRIALQRRVISAVRTVDDRVRENVRVRIRQMKGVDEVALAALAAACVDAGIWDALCHVRQVHLANEEG